MSSRTNLYLYEEILLLALKDRKGTMASGAWYQTAMGGAILAELLLGKKIQVDENDKKKLVHYSESKMFNDPLLDECIEMVKNSKKPRPLQHWVSKFSALKDLKHRAAQQLCRKGILREDEDKVMLFFTRKIYPEFDPRPEKILIGKLREAIFTETDDIDPRTIVLISLANFSGILKVIFDKKELKDRKGRLERIAEGDVVGKATKETIQAVQTAIMVATIVPVIVTTSS